MKKFLTGALVAIVVALPAGAFAWSRAQEAQPIIGFDCKGPFYTTSDGLSYADKNGKKLGDSEEPIPSPTGTDGRCSGTVYRFQDRDRTCYVVKGTNSGGIDCL